MTPAELFHRAGGALYGDQYVAPLARALDVDKNTVGKWRDGKSPVPDGVWVELHDIAERRRIYLAEVEIEIRLLRDQRKGPPAG